MTEPATDELIAGVEELLGEWDAIPSSFAAALIARIRQAEARVKVMDEALKPFAELADRYDPPEGDDDDMAWEATACPTLGQLRAARAARNEPT